MEEKNTAKDLLDIDLDAVVSKGRAKKKKVIIVIVAAVTICAGIFLVTMINYNQKMQPLYQEAMAAMESKDYSAAVDLFQKAGKYKDSPQKKADAQFAIEFLASDEYVMFRDALTANSSQYNIENVQISSVDYDADNRLIKISFIVPSSLAFDYKSLTLTPQMFAGWGFACNMLEELTNQVPSGFSESGYDVGCSVNMIDESSDEVLCEFTNGKSISNYVDMETTEDTMYSEIYNQMVSYVNDGKYKEAYDYWVGFDDYYTKDYQDLKDYVNYTKVLSAYTGGGEISLDDCLQSLNQIHSDFKDTAKYIDEITTLQESLDGTYQMGEYTLEIEGIFINIKPSDYSDIIDYYNSIDAMVDKVVVENGLVSKAIGHVNRSGLQFTFESDDQKEIIIMPNDRGIKVECKTNTAYNGIYIG